jgi:protein-tyrosine-phosphatase
LVNSREEGSRIYNRPIDLLLVCTANQCRSPMGEGLLRHLVVARNLPARVLSAGLLPSGSPATADAVAVMAERGIDIAGHVSRQVTAPIAEQADLVICMAREHVREVAVLGPDLLAKTFTLKELLRLAELAGPRQAGEPLEGWLARLRPLRRRDELLGVGLDLAYDVEDPIGQSIGRYRATADELEGLLGDLVVCMWPELRDGRELQGRTA